jgi:hypothetical protein
MFVSIHPESRGSPLSQCADPPIHFHANPEWVVHLSRLLAAAHSPDRSGQ